MTIQSTIQLFRNILTLQLDDKSKKAVSDATDTAFLL